MPSEVLVGVHVAPCDAFHDVLNCLDADLGIPGEGLFFFRVEERQGLFRDIVARNLHMADDSRMAARLANLIGACLIRVVA